VTPWKRRDRRDIIPLFIPLDDDVKVALQMKSPSVILSGRGSAKWREI
jgi:hypothetical protein